MRMVHIVGTSHSIQFGTAAASPGVFDQFVAVLTELARSLDISGIAEEANLEALTERGLGFSLPKTVADQLGLPHKYCDPDRKQRQGLEIFQENQIRAIAFFDEIEELEIQRRVRASFDKREDFRLRELDSFDSWPALFVCGANHVESFRSKLQAASIAAEVHYADWCA